MFRKPNVEQAAAALQGERDRDNASRIRYFLKDGYNILRILPATDVTPGWGDSPGRTVYMHRVDQDNHVCFTRTWMDPVPCDLCGAAKQLESMGLSDPAREMFARGKFIVLATVRANPNVRGGLREDAVKLIEGPMALRDSVMEFLDHNHPNHVPDWLDITNGRDVVCNKTGKGQQTDYAFQMSMRSSPAMTDLAKLEAQVREHGDVDRHYRPTPEARAKQAMLAASIIERAKQATRVGTTGSNQEGPAPGLPPLMPPVAGGTAPSHPAVVGDPPPGLGYAPPPVQGSGSVSSSQPPVGFGTTPATGTASAPSQPAQPAPAPVVGAVAGVAAAVAPQPTATAASTPVQPASVPVQPANPLTSVSSGVTATPPKIDPTTGRPECFGLFATTSVLAGAPCPACALSPICKIKPRQA
ncbi:MAG: hypothetical protein IPH13_20610 [Planctomycetes bacterium]|nr:hypothetical protein [Planctomycetota bacterium]